MLIITITHVSINLITMPSFCDIYFVHL